MSSTSTSSGESRTRHRESFSHNVGDSLFQEEKLLRRSEWVAVLATGSEFRRFSFELVESRWFRTCILLVILVNTVLIGLQTSEYIVAKAGWYLALADQLFLAIYITELALMLYVWRFKFFKSSWNVFDFAIVLTSSTDFVIPLIAQNVVAFDEFSLFTVLRVFRTLKALRSLRVIRTVRFLKTIQIILSTILQSIPALGSIVILISLVLCILPLTSMVINDIFAVIGRGLYGEVDPGRFGNIAQACFTLFQLMTLDDWFYMYSDVKANYPDYQHILVYLILFILFETFIFINLFVAVIVDNLARVQAAANYNKLNLKKKKLSNEHDSEVDVTRSERMVHFPEPDKQQPLSASNFYKTSDKLSDREINLIGRHFLLLNSMEHHMSLSRSHQRTFNELVDLADFSKS